MTTNRIDSHDGIRSDGMATAVLVFAHHIGIDINEEENLMHIASAYLIDLPDGWELGIPVDNEANAGIPYFFNTKSGESVWEHPLEKEILEKVKCERTRLRSAPKVKVISRRQSLTTKESPNKVKERGPETIFNSSLSPSVEAYSQVITHELHKAALTTILQLNAFSPDWDSAVHLKDIVEFLSIANSFTTTGKVQPTLISNDSRLAILAVATNLLRMQEKQSAKVSPTNRTKKDDLNEVVLALLASDSGSQPLSLTFSMAKELCLKFLITQLLNIVSSTPIGCETFADKLLKLFLSMKNRSSSEESCVSWEEATEFCFRSACWGLVNAIRAASMMTEHAISLSELRAVRLLFNKYDDELNGRMHASNLKPLLKDMSGNYSPMEVSLIIRDIDMDGTQSVELGHFIKWWCSSSPSSLLSSSGP